MSPAIAMLAGAGAAAVVQSSSLCVAGIVAAADGGGLGLGPAWAAVAGANVGGTLLPHITAWSPPGPALAICAVAGGVACLHPRLRGLGVLLLAAALLASGFALVSGAAGGGLGVASGLLRVAAVPTAAFLAGAASTAVAFSSGFTIAVAQGLAAAGGLPLTAGIAFVCGANIGTTSDVLFASLAAGRRGRITAGFHLGFKVLCAAVGLALAHPLADVLRRGSLTPARAMAQVHTGLNLGMALVLFPWLAHLAGKVELAVFSGGESGIRR